MRVLVVKILPGLAMEKGATLRLSYMLLDTDAGLVTDSGRVAQVKAGEDVLKISFIRTVEELLTHTEAEEVVFDFHAGLAAKYRSLPSVWKARNSFDRTGGCDERGE